MAPRPSHPRAARRPSSERVTARARGALTLIEIAFSLVILVFGVVSVMLLFPAGLKAQQLARFQLYACAKAQEMIDSFNSSHNANPAIDTEAFNPWDVPVSRRTQEWDLEERLSSNSFGMLPLPTAIAKRLDSEGDEIQRIVGAGGYLYYSQPMATTNLQASSLQTSPANEAQRLVCAVSGYAQSNALHIFPWKNWPYVTPFPSPPIHGLHYPDFLPTRGPATPTTFRWTDGSHDDGKTASYCWEETSDPDIQKVFNWNEPSTGVAYGYLPYTVGPLIYQGNGSGIDPATPNISSPDDRPQTTGYVPTSDGAVRYFQAALWYCRKKGLGPAFYNPPPYILARYNPVSPAVDAADPFDPDPVTGKRPRAEDLWKQVQAMRFLAHAATCLTRWYGSAQLASRLTPGQLANGSTQQIVRDPDGVVAYEYTAGIKVPQVTLDGFAGPAGLDQLAADAPDPNAMEPVPADPAGAADANQVSRITHHHLLYYHERCLRMIMAYAAAYPYDWGVPRPLQRSIMTDYPLIESDLFTAPLTGTLYNTGVAAAQWRPIPGQQITNLGRGFMFPGYAPPGGAYDATRGLPANGHYDEDGYYLSPAVPDGFWGDPAHFTLTARFDPPERCRELVFWMVDWQSYEDFETAPSAVVDAARYPFAAPLLGATFAQRMSSDSSSPDDPSGGKGSHPTGIEFRDEQLYAYRNPEKVLLFTSDQSGTRTGDDVSGAMVINQSDPDQGTGAAQRAVFSGVYGADRNFNKRLDRGPVPRSVRLRAIPVARFLYYDPRVPAVIH